MKTSNRHLRQTKTHSCIFALGLEQRLVCTDEAVAANEVVHDTRAKHGRVDRRLAFVVEGGKEVGGRVAGNVEVQLRLVNHRGREHSRIVHNVAAFGHLCVLHERVVEVVLVAVVVDIGRSEVAGVGSRPARRHQLQLEVRALEVQAGNHGPLQLMQANLKGVGGVHQGRAGCKRQRADAGRTGDLAVLGLNLRQEAEKRGVDQHRHKVVGRARHVIVQIQRHILHRARAVCLGHLHQSSKRDGAARDKEVLHRRVLLDHRYGAVDLVHLQAKLQLIWPGNEVQQETRLAVRSPDVPELRLPVGEVEAVSRNVLCDKAEELRQGVEFVRVCAVADDADAGSQLQTVQNVNLHNAGGKDGALAAHVTFADVRVEGRNHVQQMGAVVSADVLDAF
eukprot:m.25845 g.25845  ORF g.25845 m.25845 type:complete len:393 (-) comp9825_c0_seq1:492-1670(-)